MDARGVLHRHPRQTLAAICLVSGVLSVLLLEGLLHVALPFSGASIGHTKAENALKYGWGYDPLEVVQIADPDTGAVYRDRINDHGWRDRIHVYENPSHAYRVLVLGDSLTFGAIVPARHIYTRQLEQMLSDDGYNVEVISMGYGMWGTDQELEALVGEGLRYQPNLVLVQFCGNDLADNTYYLPGSERPRGLKPFFYALDADGGLVRHINPYFRRKVALSVGDPVGALSALVRYSEIGKRCYGLFLYRTLRESPIPDDTRAATGQSDVEYRVTQGRLDQLEEVYELAGNSLLAQFLQQNLDRSVDGESVRSRVRAEGLAQQEEPILRLLEKRNFTDKWTRARYYPQPEDVSSLQWRLYFALMLRMKAQANAAGAAFALLNTTEVGGYEWSRYWRRLSPEAKYRANHLDAQRILEDFATRQGIGWVANSRPYTRARNDPHPNALGNAAMAADVRAYLLAAHGAELKPGRRVPWAAGSPQ